MGGFHQFDGNKPLVYLRPQDVYNLVVDGLITPPSVEEINDRSKSDTFSKVIVLVQTMWFVTQSIARHLEHLPISQLEIATLAYTIPILGLYACWWNKPFGVTQPIRIPKSLWDDVNDIKPRSLGRRFIVSLTGKLSLLSPPRVRKAQPQSTTRI